MNVELTYTAQLTRELPTDKHTHTRHSTLCQLLIPFFTICTSATAVRDDVILSGREVVLCTVADWSSTEKLKRQTKENGHQNVNSK
jgi:hypothetical protein